MSSNSAKARFLDAVALERDGNLEDAEIICRQLLIQNPRQVPILVLLGRISRQQGRYEEAAHQLTAAQALAPSFPAAVWELGSLAAAQKDFGAARGYFTQLSQVEPKLSDARYNLGFALENLGHYKASIESYRKALELGLSNPHEACVRLGSVLCIEGRESEAREYFERALEIMPDNAGAMFGLGLVFMAFGDFESATQWLRRSVAADPNFIDVYQQLAHSKQFDDPDDPDIEMMLELLDSPDVNEVTTEKLRFALGKAYDDCGQYDLAFMHYSDANRLKVKRKPRYSREKHEDLVGRLEKAFNTDFLASAPAIAKMDITPIFIVGMPRSGTTLLEQAISCHPEIAGAGEMKFIAEVTRDRIDGYPESVVALDEASKKSIAVNFQSALRERAGESKFITDKMPSNFLHIGFLHLLFPESPIIHCRRSAADVCLSIFFQDLPTGNPYANDLSEIAHYYRCYEQIMSYWDSVLPGRIHHLDYEDVTQNFEAEITKVLEYCGLQWHDNCREYASNEKAVATVSRWQVRQPVYQRSVERWKRYELHLGELLAALEQPMETNNDS